MLREQDYLVWQPCRHVCAWLSHALMQGEPKVVGHTRWQEAL